MLEFSGQSNDFDLVTKGDYEVILNMEWKRTKAGDNYINCAFKIRKDVEQPYAGRLIFDAIYKSKTTGAFNASKINGILAAIPNAKLSFENYDELIQYCNDQPMKITVDAESTNSEDPNAKMKNIVKYLSYRPSQVALNPQVEVNQNAENEQPHDPFEQIDAKKIVDEIDENDLPF